MNCRMEAILPYNIHSPLDTLFCPHPADRFPVWDGIVQLAMLQKVAKSLSYDRPRNGSRGQRVHLRWWAWNICPMTDTAWLIIIIIETNDNHCTLPRVKHPSNDGYCMTRQHHHHHLAGTCEVMNLFCSVRKFGRNSNMRTARWQSTNTQISSVTYVNTTVTWNGDSPSRVNLFSRICWFSVGNPSDFNFYCN